MTPIERVEAATEAHKYIAGVTKKLRAAGYSLPKRFKVTFSQRMTVTAGTAEEKPNGDLEIALSWPIWLKADKQERANTVVHEYVHLVVGNRHAHNRVWKRAMIEAGYEPRIGHSVRLDLPWVVVCGCEPRDRTTVTGQKRAAIVRITAEGRYYKCRKCKGKVTDVVHVSQSKTGEGGSDDG